MYGNSEIEEINVTVYSPCVSDYINVLSQAKNRWGDLNVTIDSGNMIRSCHKVGDTIIIR